MTDQSVDANKKVPPIIERLDALRAETLKNKAAFHNGVPIKHWEESGEQLKHALIQAYPELRTLLIEALRENERYRNALESALAFVSEQHDAMYQSPTCEKGNLPHAPRTDMCAVIQHARKALGGNDA